MHNSNILIFIDSFSGGGAQRVVVDILNNWPKDSSIKPILLLKSDKGPYKKFLNKNIEIIVLKKPLMFKNIFYNGKEITDLIKFFNVKLIISHLVGNNRTFLRLKLFRFIKIPIVVCEHNNISLQYKMTEKNILKKFFIKQEIKFLYKFSNAIVAVSKDLRIKLIQEFGFCQSKIFYIPNPIDTNYIEKMVTKTPNDKFAKKFDNYKNLKKIISVGTLTKQKNFSFLLDICEEIIKVEKKLKIIIFGEGNCRKNLEKKILSRGLKDFFELPGFTDNPWWYIYRANVYVLCSLWEGYPLILNESISCRTRIVSINCDFGPREIIDDNVGKLINEFDKKEFSKIILEELKFPKSKIIDKLIKQRLKSQTPKEISTKYNDLLENVIANPQKKYFRMFF